MTFKRLALILFALIIIACASTAIWVYSDFQTKQTHHKAEQYIQIKRGSSPSEIISTLESQGVIRRGWLLMLYLKFSGRGSKLKAGEYRFPSPITPLEVVAKLEKGEELLIKFTVIEGWTKWDIAEAMLKTPEFKLNSKDDALSLMNDTSAIKDIDPKAENLEGYLYPDTYSFPKDYTAKQAVFAMVARFRKEWKPEWTSRAIELKKTPREIVTLASLIETEAKLDEDRPLISSVIYNRLRLGMKLGIDSAIIYASKLAGKWRNDGKVYKSDLDRDSPYNTRLYAGLPPGPISATGAKSLNAAFNPALTDFLYYVREPSRDDGKHNFYNNSADFEKGVQKLREWERQRDATQGASNK